MNAQIWTLPSIRSANLARQGAEPWFSRGNMRMFKTQVLRGVYQGDGGVFFVTGDPDISERPGPMRYSVRQFNPAGSTIKTVPESYRSFVFASDARDHAKALAAGARKVAA